ncbi:sugar porter family MFS transporter [Aspergillus glaucus CBS 516.65]|uniref:Major facilitator superfamily (MFS) profile domain-containing protein n=1 Tax=Aspergillus glaucus CBS 516.65 TaxID=1160497 RepID=A0A1L9V5R4_ASPGL|nr:hypothetical protein ASPGLDRAFT_70226 [Aspergillus glaucus CBS 516.65]OJJ79209.1 hypothetical protein ASPGLDRAFT_70226 [Aspergillus glaucus CBS 516.65]
MGVETSAHHGESISEADLHQPQSPIQKPMMTGVDTPIPRLTLRTFIMGVFASLGGLVFGYDTGQISGFQEMDNYKQRYGELGSDGTYYFSNVRTGLIVSLLSIGTLIGALCGAPIADKLGRKWTISVCTPAAKWYQMVVGRWVTGLGVGGCSLVVPMYQGESAPRHIRGAIICSYQLFITMGIFLSYLFNLGTESLKGTAQWRITLGLTFVFALTLGGGILFFPETPRFNFRQGRVDRAQSNLAKFYGIPENHTRILEEMGEIHEQLEAEITDQKWTEFLTAPRIFVTQVILGAVNFGMTFGGLYIVENFGRRKSLTVGATFMFICFIAFASVGHFVFDHVTPENTPGAGKGMVVLACLFISAYAMTWGPMIWAIAAELFPSKYRAKGMALATASNWLWNFLIGFFTPFITGDIDYAYGYVFAGCLFVGIFVVYFCVIEGRGRTLEELDWMYVNHVPPWKSADYELPQRIEYTDPGYSRKENDAAHTENV